MRQMGSPTTFETVKVVGSFGGKRIHLFVPGDKKGEWVMLPPKFKVTIDDGSAPYDIEIDCAVNGEKRILEIVSFKATKRETQIQDNVLRNISLAAIRAEAVRRIGELMTEGKDGKLHSKLFEPKKPISDDVVQRAIYRPRKNKRDLNEARQITNFARALVEKGVKDWRQQTQKEFGLTKAAYYRWAKDVNFKASKFKRKAKK